MTTNDSEYRSAEQGFFEAIEEDPCELATWLIFADFLEDHGHPSAEVTRLWATGRFGRTLLGEHERGRLDALLTSGLRPHLPRVVNTTGMEFVLVPSGTFWMTESDEDARRRVEVSNGFYLGIHPVTQGQWQNVMGNNPSYFSRAGGGMRKVKDIPDAVLKQFPVEQVSWEDARQFLAELNQWDNLRVGWVYRLPTEAEWEYGCRGGATSWEDCSFDFYFAKPTYELSADRANFVGIYPAGNGYRRLHLARTTTAGSYQPNALGIHDMHGNVYEWCEDLHEDGTSRVARGGGWNSYAIGCRAGSRGRYPPGVRDSGVGFRLALVPAGK